MNLAPLASRPRSRFGFVFVALALTAGCSGGGTTDDGSTPNDSSSNGDGTTMDTGSATDATDGPRQRDTGPEISLDSGFTQCMVAVSPRTGTTADTFVVTGTAFRSSPTVTLRIGPESGGALIVNMEVPVTDGMFTYSLPGAGLAPGNYSATAMDPSFVCSFTGPFTVQ